MNCDHGQPTTTPTREQRLGDAFIALADTLVAGYDLAELMQYLVDTSVGVLDVAAAGLLLTDRAGRLQVLASTSHRADSLELFQVRNNAGPCIDCFTTGQPQTIPDLGRHTRRWPAFVDAALAQGIRSVHAFPMRLRTHTIGALNLLGTDPGTLTGPDQRAAQALADAATIGILHERAAHDAADLNDRLQHALNSRVVIEQAKGLLANHGNLDMDQAFDSLRRYARTHHLPLTELAHDLVARRRRTAAILADSAPARTTKPRA